ncbi:peptidase u61 ld-carboxypeptidase a [Thozetella sp. PMI_491]|nr:peptidase u61 ld-carboxypeptidase a [Thozetella sp. PMI_491]
MPSIWTPKALEPGATIGLISASARLNHRLPAVISRATTLLSNRGYSTRIFFTPDNGIQSGITNRVSELREALSDPTISAIICVIGGETFTELLPDLIADTELHEKIRAHPKIVVGMSDNTGLHWFLYSVVGLRTFYGPGIIPELGAPESVDDEATPLAFSVKALFKAISNREPLGDLPRSLTYAPKMPAFFGTPDSVEPQELAPTAGWIWLRPGKAEGRLFGGCLTVISRLQGVRPIAPDWRGRIVFLETSVGDGDNLSAVRAGFADLIAQGVFDEAAGLVVGRPYGYDTEEKRNKYAGIIKSLLCEGRMAEKQFPILFNVDFGHTTPMITLPFDALASLDSESDRFTVLEPGVL